MQLVLLYVPGKIFVFKADLLASVKPIYGCRGALVEGPSSILHKVSSWSG